MERYCAQCGQKLKSDSRFCPQCGERVEQEKSLIQRAQENDVQAWETIYQNTYARAYSVAIQIVKIREDALDILQEAYISAFKNINSLRDEAKIGAWINSIVSNRCKDWIRKKKPMLFTDMNSEEYDVEFEDVLMNDNQEFMPEESMDYEQTKAIMQEILWKLPEDQRLCVLMYYYNEMSVSAIAETLECSDGTIKSRLNYARKFIKREVEELEKKGTKLYSIAPLPFIVWMLRSNEHTIMAEAADRPLKNAIRELVKNETKEVVKSAIEKEAGQTAKETVAEEAAKAARKAGGKHIAKKIISGIVAVSLVGTGSYVASKKYHKKQETIKVTGTKDTGTKSDKKGKETNKAEKKENELRELKQKVDYDYLERLCSYFPADTPYQDMTDDDWKRFYTTIMQTAYEDYYCPHEYGEHFHFWAEIEYVPSDNPANQNELTTPGIMEITAHRNDKSKIGGFVFDKITYKPHKNNLVARSIESTVNLFTRVKENFDFNNPTGTYDVNSFSDKEITSYINFFIGDMGGETDKIKSKYKEIIGDSESDVAYQMKVNEYKKLAEDTLGRTKSFKIAEVEETVIKGNTVQFWPYALETYIYIDQINSVESFDGNIKIEGTLRLGGEQSKENEYIFKAQGHRDSKSQTGVVVNKLVISNE